MHAEQACRSHEECSDSLFYLAHNLPFLSLISEALIVPERHTPAMVSAAALIRTHIALRLQDKLLAVAHPTRELREQGAATEPAARIELRAQRIIGRITF